MIWETLMNYPDGNGRALVGYNCAFNVMSAVKDCNLKESELFTPSCTQTYNNLKHSEYWREVGDFEVDDVILFQWPADRTSGDMSHIGVVKSVNKTYKTVTYVDFNSANNPFGKAEHTVNFDYSCIKHVYRYKLDTGTAGTVIKFDANATELPTLSKGSKGSAVLILQACLMTEENCDGFFGIKTENAVKEWQLKKDLEVDGIVGNNTWKSLITYIINYLE